jgi:hypothetical protein
MYTQDNNKDKRISFLSIFSTIYDNTHSAKDWAKVAEDVNDLLYIKYPLTEEVASKAKPVEGEACACGIPREYREGVKDGRQWRAMMCKRKVCSPIWLPKVATKKESDRASFQDSIDADANSQR